MNISDVVRKLRFKRLLGTVVPEQDLYPVFFRETRASLQRALKARRLRGFHSIEHDNRRRAKRLGIFYGERRCCAHSGATSIFAFPHWKHLF